MTQQMMFNRFVLDARLGSGGMGVVYRAYDRRREEWVALKTLEKVSIENFMSLKREFRVASLLHHPNLVRFYDLLSDGSACALSMELIEGQNLVSYIRDAVADAPTISVDAPTAAPVESLSAPVMLRGSLGATYHLGRLLAVFPQLCLGLDALHQEGLAHRDIKPSNILCTQSGVCKILDFGTTRAFRASFSVDDARVIEGTPHYMSPEQARGERVGPPSDMYSLGVLLYLLLTGMPPFQGKTTKRILEMHAQEDPLPPSQIAQGIPNELEELCLSLLQKDPHQRPTARELAVRLADLGAPAVEFPKGAVNRFVGRSQEMIALAESAEKAYRGARRAVFIGGESGAGKSSLVSALVRKLSLSGWKILAGRCYERESLPYNALDSILDSLSIFAKDSPAARELPGVSDLVAMFPVLRGALGVEPSQDTDVANARQRAAVALRGLLRLFAKERPLSLWIDDLQWADADSLYLLACLFEGEEKIPLLLLGTYRTTREPNDALKKFLANSFVQSLLVGPLGVEALRGLVGGSLEKATQIAQESKGNAFFASELAFAVQSGEATQGDLTSLLLGRIRRLSQPLQQTMDTAAAAGGAVTFEQLKEVTGIGASSLSRALDDLLFGRWLRTIDDSLEETLYDVYHDRIREVLYAKLEPGKRKLLHMSFAAALEDTGEPEAIANHYQQAGEPSLSAPWFLKAAQKAAKQLAAERASELYTQALAAGGDSWPSAQLAREELAYVLDRVGGRYQDAAHAYREAASHVQSARKVRLLVRAAESELKLGAIESARKTAILAMSPYEKLTFPQSSAAAFTESVWLNLNVEWHLKNLTIIPERRATQHDILKHLLLHRMAGVFLYFDLMQGTVLAMRSLVLALSRGATEDLIDAITLYGAFVALRRGRANTARAEELFQRCVPAFYALHEPEVDVWVRDGSPSTNALLAGDFARAKGMIQQTILRYREIGRGAGHEMTAFQSFLAICESALGDPAAGIAILQPLFTRAVEEQDQLALRAYSLPLAHLYLLTGEPDLVWKTANELPATLHMQSLLTGMPLAYHKAGALLMAGQPREAIALLEALLDAPLENGLLAFGEAKIRSRALLSLCYLSLAKQESATQLASLDRAWKLISTVTDCDDAVLEGITFRVAGLIWQAKGDIPQARKWLRRAVESLEQRGEAVELAATLLARGALLDDKEDIERGRAILQRGGFVDPAEREGFSWSWKKQKKFAV